MTAVEPRTGSVDGGTEVTITGSNFSDITSITFGGTAAVLWTLVSDTSLTVTAPAGALGVGDVVVTTAGGSSPTSDAAWFEWLRNPLTTLQLSSQAVPGGFDVRGVMRLTYPAPSTGLSIPLTWRRTPEDVLGLFPTTAFVPSGSTEGSFVASTFYVSSPVQIQLTAEHWGEQRAALTVGPQSP